jgi:hypothetical protein
MDRIQVKVEFKKALWTCPVCSQEDYEDMNPAGGNTYSHNCSNCNEWFNTFKEYNGVLSYPFEKFDLIDKETIAAQKNIAMVKWVTEIKNPFIPKEPTKEELEQQKLDYERQLTEMTQKIADVATKIDKIDSITADVIK